jgi:hypothetical protein
MIGARANLQIRQVICRHVALAEKMMSRIGEMEQDGGNGKDGGNGTGWRK